MSPRSVSLGGCQGPPRGVPRKTRATPDTTASGEGCWGRGLTVHHVLFCAFSSFYFCFEGQFCHVHVSFLHTRVRTVGRTGVLGRPDLSLPDALQRRRGSLPGHSGGWTRTTFMCPLGGGASLGVLTALWLRRDKKGHKT